MDLLQASLALIGVLLTALTTIPIIRELASHRERTTVSLAREVISGTCGAYEREYWTNSMNDALKRIEARRAYPAMLRGIIALVLYFLGTLAWMAVGWMAARLDTTRSAGLLACIITLVLYIFGIIGLSGALHTLSDLASKRAKIYTLGNSKKRIERYLWMLFGLSVYLFGFAMARGYSFLLAQEYEREPTIQWVAYVLLFTGVTIPVAIIVRSLLRYLDSDDRADEHLVPRERLDSNSEADPTPIPWTWKPVRRYVAMLFILDLFTRKKTG